MATSNNVTFQRDEKIEFLTECNQRALFFRQSIDLVRTLDPDNPNLSQLEKVYASMVKSLDLYRSMIETHSFE